MVYDLNTLAGTLNINISKQSKVILELVDDNKVQVKTVPNDSINLRVNKDVSNSLSISKNGNDNNPWRKGLPSLPSEMVNSNKFNVYVSRLQSNSSKQSKSEIGGTDLNA